MQVKAFLLIVVLFIIVSVNNASILKPILPIGRVTFRNISYLTETCNEVDLQPGGIFHYNETYTETEPSEYRSPDCIRFWADPNNNVETNFLPRSILPAKTLLEDTKHANTLNVKRMKKLFTKLTNPEEKVHIYVFGGSLTAGLNVNWKSGAWPKTFENMWNWLGDQAKAVNGLAASIKITNLAVGGTSSEWALHRLNAFIGDEEEVDLIILDYDVNDCMVVWDDDEDHENALPIFELLVKRLLELPQKVAILYMNTAISHGRGMELKARCSEYRQCWQQDRLKNTIYDAYSIPMISQRDAVWTNFICPPTAQFWDCTHSHCAHPSWGGHELMAKILFTYLEWGLEKYSKEGILTKSDDDALVQALVQEDFLTKQGSTLNNKICLQSEAQVDHINAPYISLDYVEKMNLEEGAIGEGIKIALNTDDEHQNYLQEKYKTKKHYKNVKIVDIDLPCWGYHEDVQGRHDKLGWVVEADESTTDAILGTDSSRRKRKLHKHRKLLRGSYHTNNTDIQLSPRKLENRKDCFGSHITFQMKIGNREQFSIIILNTYDKHAGIAEVSISSPLTLEQIHSDYVSPDNDFSKVGILDAYYDSPVSIITPFIFPNEFKNIHRNTTQQIRITLMDGNREGLGFRDRFEKRSPRLYSQKLKIESISTC